MGEPGVLRAHSGMERTLGLLVLMLLGARAQPRHVEGPGFDRDARIVKVVIEKAVGAHGHPVVTTDQKTIDLAERLFSDEGWEESTYALVPDYRVHRQRRTKYILDRNVLRSLPVPLLLVLLGMVGGFFGSRGYLVSGCIQALSLLRSDACCV